MGIIVTPGMTLPVAVGAPTPDPGSSRTVTFAVATESWGVEILISLCIKVTIGGVTVKIYFSSIALANGSPVEFSALLPMGSDILETVATYSYIG